MQSISLLKSQLAPWRPELKKLQATVAGAFRWLQLRSAWQRTALIEIEKRIGPRFDQPPSPESAATETLLANVLDLGRRALTHGDQEAGLEIALLLRRVSYNHPEATILLAQHLWEARQKKKAEGILGRTYLSGTPAERRKRAKAWLKSERDYVPFYSDLINANESCTADDPTSRFRAVQHALAIAFVRERLPHPNAGWKQFKLLLHKTDAGARALSPDTSKLREQANELFADAKYREARDLLREALYQPTGFHPQIINLLARSEMALSEYRRAERLTHFSRWTKKYTAEGRYLCARIAWIQHRYAEGEAEALKGLAVSPQYPRLKAVLDACQRPLHPPNKLEAGRHLTHVAFHAAQGGNFGDISLPVAVRQAFEDDAPVGGWTPIHVHQVIDEKRLEYINSTQGVVVGGGGLFLPDTSPNGASGWQWNVTEQMLNRIDVPLALYAVGYNLFRGQTFQGDLFKRSLTAITEKCEFIGLRNQGSVQRVRDLLPNSLAHKVTCVPCPTTVLSLVNPRIRNSAPPAPSGPIYINLAYDRSSRRFGNKYTAFLADIAKIVRSLQRAGHEVRCASHMASDERFVRDISEAHHIQLETDRLSEMHLDEAYQCYRKAALVIGMRGHATMIPFGLGTPVLSLISHPKMKFFLDDIHRNEWGIDISEKNLGEQVAERALSTLTASNEIRQDIADIQLKLLSMTREHTERFRRTGPSSPSR